MGEEDARGSSGALTGSKDEGVTWGEGPFGWCGAKVVVYHSSSDIPAEDDEGGGLVEREHLSCTYCRSRSETSRPQGE